MELIPGLEMELASLWLRFGVIVAPQKSFLCNKFGSRDVWYMLFKAVCMEDLEMQYLVQHPLNRVNKTKTNNVRYARKTGFICFTFTLYWFLLHFPSYCFDTRYNSSRDILL